MKGESSEGSNDDDSDLHPPSQNNVEMDIHLMLVPLNESEEEEDEEENENENERKEEEENGDDDKGEKEINELKAKEMKNTNKKCVRRCLFDFSRVNGDTLPFVTLVSTIISMLKK